MLKTLFTCAKRWNYREDNPAWDIKKFKEAHNEMDFLQPHEINPLLEKSTEPYRTLFLTAIFTGMRRAELLGLKWGDVDWYNNTIRVRRTLHFKKQKNTREGETRWYFEDPKTKQSRRAIIMSPRLKRELENHKFNETIRLGQIEDSPINIDDLIFTNQVGNPIDPDNITERQFHPALKLAELRLIRLHDLRHTFASLLINQGANIKFIQNQMGHASAQITLDRYGHLMPLENYSNVGIQLDEQIENTPPLPEPALTNQ